MEGVFQGLGNSFLNPCAVRAMGSFALRFQNTFYIEQRKDEIAKSSCIAYNKVRQLANN